MNKSVITIAVGKTYYLKLAENLLNSFLLSNKKNEICFLLLTDNSDFFAQYEGNPKVFCRQIYLDEAEKSFTTKFKLFEYSIADENLFIDCDCLVYRDIDFIFREFEGKSFSSIGNDITEGAFFCDVKTILSYFKLKALPKFVGSVYYFKKDDKAKRIFKTAGELKKKYDELGFIRLRNKENEEPLFSVALRLENEELLPNTGYIKADLMYYKNIVSNVLIGKAHASKPILQITGGEKIPGIAYPAILHFNASFSDNHIYKSESYRLKYAQHNRYLTEIIVCSRFKFPYLIKNNLKNFFRPICYFFLGHRSIRKSTRMF